MFNQKMNQSLEGIAKAIFKSWFIDFDPVRAKAEGRHTGLSKEIRDLIVKLINEIPKISDNFEQVLSSESAYQMISMLEGAVQRLSLIHI